MQTYCRSSNLSVENNLWIKHSAFQCGIAGPGFININLHPDFLRKTLLDLLLNGVTMTRPQTEPLRVGGFGLCRFVLTTIR